MAASKVGRKTRQWLVFLHVVVSLGWMGAGAANVVLAVTAATTASAEVRRVCYHMIDRIDAVLVIPGAFAALVSGIVLSLVTPWGLARYWWVLLKLVLTVAVIVWSTLAVGVWVLESIDATAASPSPSPVARALSWGAGANILAFLLMTWASVAKPWGRTPWGGAQRGGGSSRAARTRRSRRVSVTDSSEVSPSDAGALKATTAG
jgi:hypothetical protein